jgi:hypothetical protein
VAHLSQAQWAPRSEILNASPPGRAIASNPRRGWNGGKEMLRWQGSRTTASGLQEREFLTGLSDAKGYSGNAAAG